MPDVFDTLESPPASAAARDVFDEVNSQPAGDVFDQVAAPHFATGGKFDTSGEASPVVKPQPAYASHQQSFLDLLNAKNLLARGVGSPEAYQSAKDNFQKQLLSELQEHLGQEAAAAREQSDQNPAWQFINTPAVQLEPGKATIGGRTFADAEQYAPKSNFEKRALGVREGIDEFLSSLTSPLSVATIGAAGVLHGVPALGRALSAIFAAQTGKSLAVDTAKQLGEEYAKPEGQRDPQRLASLWTSAATGLPFTAALGVHALRGEPGLKQEAPAESSPVAEKPVPRAENPVPQDVFDEIAPEVSGESPETTGGSPVPPGKESLPGEKLVEEIRASAIPPKPATVEIEGQAGQQKLDPSALLDLQAAMRNNQVAGSQVPSEREMSISPASNEVAKRDTANKVEPAPETSTSLNEGKASEMLAEPVQRSSEASGDEPPAKVAGTSPGASSIPEAPATSAGASISGESPEITGGSPVPPKQISEAPELIQARAKLESLKADGKGKSDQAFRVMARIAKLETPKKVARGITGSARFNSETNAHGPDILSWIADTMPLLSKHQAREVWGREKFQANKSQWDGAPQNLGSPHHNVIYRGMNEPNRVAQAAFEAGEISDPHPDTLWTAIKTASETRLRNNARTKREAAFLKEEIRQHEAWTKATSAGEQRVSADQLKVGDLFEVDGERIEVADVNPDTGDVTLKDGRKFGKEIHVESGQALHVEKFESPVEPEPAPLPKLRSGERQGDLMATQREDFALAGERGADADRIQREKENAAATAAEAKAIAAKQQGTLSIEEKLDALKINTKGTVQAFGLLPEAWNTLIDLVKTAVKAGRKINQAIDWAFAQFKELHPEQKFDEAGAREHFLKEEGESGRRGNADPTVKWEDLKERVAQAENDLRAAIKAPAPDETAAAKSVREKRKAEATAKFRTLDDQLHEHPDYLKHLYELQGDLVTRLRQVKEEVSGESPETTGGSPVPPGDELRFKLQSKIEEIDAEVQRFPARMRNKVYNELFGEPPSAAEIEANKDVEPGPLSERNETPLEDMPAELPEGKLQRALAELPGHVREIFKSAKGLKTKLAEIIRRRGNSDVISYTKDAADNRANIFGRQAANVVLHELNRAFGEKDVNARNSDRETALTFVVESGRNRAALDEFENYLRTSEHRMDTWSRRAISAIQQARKYWDRFQPAAELYEKITDAQVAAENGTGIKTLHRSGGYVFHLQDVVGEWGELDGGGGGGPSAPFKHIRDYPTYAQAIHSGVTPRTLNAVDLLHRRLTLGRKLINYRAWQEAMGDLIDPTSEKPVMTDVITKVRKDGSKDIAAPPGYHRVTFAGQEFAIHNGYDGLFDDLTAASKFAKGTVRPILMRTAATTKHLMLLFDTYHLGRLAFWNSVTRGSASGTLAALLPGNPFAYKKGITLLDNTIEDIQQMVRNGEIPKEWENDLLEHKRQLDGLLKAGLNVGSARDNVYSDWIHKIPVTGKFNTWLFDQFQRGAMGEASLIELQRQRAMYPKVTEAELMRRVARDLNVRFGNLQSQGWIKSKTFQDLARMIFLAPSWNESLIRAEAGAVRDIVSSPVQSFRQGRPAMGLLGRTVATAVLGQFIANQIINYITRGHPTWQNEEEGFGAKVSAYIPDVVGNGPGFFLNPFVLPAEIAHLLMEKTERSGDPTQAAKEFVSGRLGTVGRLVYTPLVREDEMGAKLRGGWEVLGQMGKQSLPVPISAGAAFRASKQLITGEHEELYPGQFEKQAFQTFGIKTQTAPDAERRMQALAGEFKKEKGIKPSAEFFHGDYYFLDRAARIGNVREMKKEMEKLIEKKSPPEIRKHYQTWARAPFSGSRPREVEFKATLTPEQLKVYALALEKRQQIRERVLQFLP
jgi:hypothetical protein